MEVKNYWHKLKSDFKNYIHASDVTPRYYNEFSRSFDLLAEYATANGYDEYSPELGFAFFKSEQENPRYKGESTIDRRRKAIRRLNIYLYGDSYWQRAPRNLREYRKSSNLPQCPAQFSDVFEEFIQRLAKEGLRESTVNGYRRTIVALLIDFAEQGVDEWSNLGTRNVTSAFLRSTNKEHFVAQTRRFCRYLVVEGVVEADYSGVLVKPARQKVIPSVYTEAEIQQLLGCVETITPQGKRDYAIILIAVRLGLRASDIQNLRFENVDFEKNIITFIQIKTSVQHQLSIPAEVVDALRDYIDNGREHSNESHVFLNCYGSPLATHYVSRLISRRFKKSGINIGNRSFGSHSLRMTFASQLIEENVPYEAVRTLLGQVDPNSTRRYVEFAIEGLRACALEVPMPSGRLEQYLAKGVTYNGYINERDIRTGNA